MARAPYNTTVDVWSGPVGGGPHPGTVRIRGLVCRVVPVDRVLLIEAGWWAATAWLTCGNNGLYTSKVTLTATQGKVDIDMRAADQIALAGAAKPTWYVLSKTQVVQLDGTAYYRYNLKTLTNGQPV